MRINVRPIALVLAALICCGSKPGYAPIKLRFDAPKEITLYRDVPSDLRLIATGVDSSAFFSVVGLGLPTGLTTIVGDRSTGRVELRVYGIPGSAEADSNMQVAWRVSNRTVTIYVHSVLHIRSAQQIEDLEGRVKEVVTASYSHGMPPNEIRSLGSRALPILARMLRDDAYRSSWHRIASAIGFIGDTSYFDTLRVFVWDRFRGRIDGKAFMAMQAAQAGMGPMATVSSRALEYLGEVATPDAWLSLPWTADKQGTRREKTTEMMSISTLFALAYTDNDGAGEILEVLTLKPNTRVSRVRDEARRINAGVRAVGFPQYWSNRRRRH